MSWDARDHGDLVRAVALIEHPGFAARLTELLGRPVEGVVGLLPARVADNIQTVTHAALSRLLGVAVTTLRGSYRGKPRVRTHKLMAAVSGGVGGAFGVAALAVELPLSTSLMLRSIADIARSEGEDIRSLPARLACLEVFALGGRRGAKDGAESGYYAVRAALAKAVSDAAKYIAERGLAEKGAPAIVRLISQIAARFGAVVSEKVAVQAVPVIGALGGAAVNLAFMGHFQALARGHFIVRRLERTYGEDVVRAEYARLARGTA